MRPACAGPNRNSNSRRHATGDTRSIVLPRSDEGSHNHTAVYIHRNAYRHPYTRTCHRADTDAGPSDMAAKAEHELAVAAHQSTC